MSDHTFLPAWREQSLGRRVFLRVSAASAASVALIAAGCSDTTPTPIPADPYQLALPAGDSGLMYYAYLMALAQTTLYQKVVDAPPTDLTTAERAVFADLRDHEVVHQQTIRYLIDPTGTNQLLPTEFAFSLSKFTLSTRAGVLAAAQQIADLVAAAYPVLLTLFTTSSIRQRALLLKMSSVQARQAAAVRDLLAPGSFANSDVVDSAGQLLTKTPTEVIAALAPYFAPYVISVASLAVPV
jgi:Ferritin-like domain